MYELVTSAKSCSYFVRNHVIRQPLTDNQLEWLEHDKGYKFMNGGRRTYRTSTMLAKALWCLCFKPNSQVLYTAPRQFMVDEARYQFSNMLHGLPAYLRPELLIDNKNSVQAAFGSTVRFQAMTRNSSRGLSIDLVLLDNTSHADTSMPEFHASIMPALSACNGVMMTTW